MKIKITVNLVIIVLACLIILPINEADAQIRRGRNNSKNKRISNYRGGAVNFKKDKRYWSAGFNINSTNYFGDVTPTTSLLSTDFSATRMGAGFSVTYRLFENISAAASLNWNRVYGDDFSADPMDPQSGVYRYTRNLHFRNDIMEFSAVGIFDLFANRGTYFVRPPLVPYGFLGLAVYYHNPKAKAPYSDLNGAPLPDGGKWVALKPLGTEGQNSTEYGVKPYGNVQLAIPFGLGVRYKMSNYVDFEFEVGYRYLFTDYIDDVSTDYVDLGVLEGELAKAMSFRSLEPIAITTGKERIVPAEIYTMTSRFDGRTYHVLGGYGHDGVKNVRGNPQDNDHYIVTSLKIKYILHAKSRNVKFR